MAERSPLSHPNADVRMRGFHQRATVAAALAWVDEHIRPLAAESVPLEEAASRVLACDISSTINVPGFARSMMDGFALRAADTHGASAYNRLRLTIIAEALPGQSFDGQIASGEAVRIMTGAPLPTGADAVLPAEQTESDGTSLWIQGEVSPGKHVGLPGEDIQARTKVLSVARLLRPQDVGLLSSIGLAEVPVVQRPRVKIIATGNELLPPGSAPVGCQIADANSPMLRALVHRDGGIVVQSTLVGDDPAEIQVALGGEADVILVSGGSSVGQEDFVPKLLDEHGELAIHGVAMRPSSPAGMGRLADSLVFLLPGNPVSCLCAYDFFAGRAIRALGGRSIDWPYRRTLAPLRRKLVSVVGRLDYARVTLAEGQVEPVATSGASVLSSTTRADGFVIVPSDSEGYPAGTEVEVYMYD